MPSFCCVINCSNRGCRDKVGFYTIPAVRSHKHKTILNDLSMKRRKAWINAIKRADMTEEKIKHFRVCSEHFIEGRPSALEDNLNPDWVPTLKMGYRSLTKDNVGAKERFNRKRRRDEQMQLLISSESASQVKLASTKPKKGKNLAMPTLQLLLENGKFKPAESPLLDKEPKYEQKSPFEDLVKEESYNNIEEEIEFQSRPKLMTFSASIADSSTGDLPVIASSDKSDLEELKMQFKLFKEKNEKLEQELERRKEIERKLKMQLDNLDDKIKILDSKVSVPNSDFINEVNIAFKHFLTSKKIDAVVIKKIK